MESLLILPNLLSSNIHITTSNIHISQFEMDAYVYVYTFQFLYFFRLEHTEIQYSNIYVSYSPSGKSLIVLRVEMIIWFELFKGLRVSNYADRTKTLKRIIYAGESTLSLQQFFVYLRELQTILDNKKYCIFTFNCRHVSLQVLNRLGCYENEGLPKFLLYHS